MTAHWPVSWMRPATHSRPECAHGGDPGILTVGPPARRGRLHGAVAGNTLTGSDHKRRRRAIAENTTVTTNRTLNGLGKSLRIMVHSTDSADHEFVVRETHRCKFHRGRVQPGRQSGPAAGAFSLVMTISSRTGRRAHAGHKTLEAAMAEAYVKVLFDVGDSINNVPIVLNVEDNHSSRS